MERELLFNKALEELKKEKKIEDFIWHGWLSMADLRGIDFSVIVIDFAKGKRVVYPLSVTGHRWVAGHLEKHPKVTTIPVKMGEKIDVIKKDILRAIKNGNGHKQN